MDHNTNVEGWRQVRAGCALVDWSLLAQWDNRSLSFIAAEEGGFESANGHRRVDENYGRLICWLTFAIGVEYLSRGVCLLHGRDVLSKGTVIRFPSKDEELRDWMRLVISNAASIRQDEVKSRSLGKLPVGDVVANGDDRELVSASIKLLASAIRNRDAHRYAENVRAFHFFAVRDLFVPTLNILIGTLDQTDLANQIAASGSA